MARPIDLTPATRRLADVAARISDDDLDSPTPDSPWTVGQLLAHVIYLSDAFRAAASKELGDATDAGPTRTPELVPEWQPTLDHALVRLADAWRDPAAWEGDTRAGGLDMPGESAGIVALDEIVLHGWDLAVATGQEYTAADDEIEALAVFVEEFDPAGSPGMFGPALDADDDTSPFERLLARAGRDPGWSPPGA
ncbi:TIGR03086 family metal-binding protein [Georgenia sp. Z1344]|uniref:TIGR03086 family metal-binding protein n=1 Tax=Georgenia sp. Z1344 TaxID=3416706 RepID=UPI003CEE12B7